jgi:hypothetical protein
MSKKFSIVKTLDINKLDNEIENYIHISNNKNPYIFMSDATADSIAQHYDPIDIYSNVKLGVKDRCGCWGSYVGYKVFVDNSLKYGEIEIR